MSEFTRYLRQRLGHHLDSGTVDAIERDLVTRYRGDRVYVGSVPESQREQTRALIVQGMSARNARRKVSGR